MEERATRARPGVIALGVLVALRVHAQTPQPEEQPRFRTHVSVLEVSAVVIDRTGKPIVDLSASDFEVLEDGATRALAGFRRLGPRPPRAARTSLGAASLRPESVVTNKDVADAPIFVVLLDDLNTSPYHAHRVIRAGLGLVRAVPRDGLLAVLSTSGVSGTALTPTPPSPEHTKRVEAFRGQLLLSGPPPNVNAPRTIPSRVGAPCGVGSAVVNSQDCGDPTRAERRARTVEAIADALRRAGGRRRVLFWVTEDMGVSPLAAEASRNAQRAALRAALNAGVAVYPVNPLELFAPTLPGESVERPGDHRPDQRAGNKLQVGDTTIELGTDDLVAVTLDRLARDSGGRWIRDTNDLDGVLGNVVVQNTSSYLLTYESPNAHLPGVHRIDVRVRREGAQVFARRGYIVEDERAGVTAPATARPATPLLSDLLSRVIPQGHLTVRAQVVPMTGGSSGQSHAVSLLSIDASTSQGRDVDVAVVTYDDRGRPANQRTLRLTHPVPGGVWESAVNLRLSRGKHQLRVAAATVDGTQTGLVLDEIDTVEHGRDLWLGPLLLLSTDAGTMQPTLIRQFRTGRPQHIQAEIAGRDVADASVQITASLVDQAGIVVRESRPVLEPGARKDQKWVRSVIETNELPAGLYVVLVVAKSASRGGSVTRSIPLELHAMTSDR